MYLYLVSSNSSAGRDESLIRREDTDNLLYEETLASPRPAGDEDVLARLDALQHEPLLSSHNGGGLSSQRSASKVKVKRCFYSAKLYTGSGQSSTGKLTQEEETPSFSV